MLDFILKKKEGTNKQAVATIVDVSQDGGYVGVGWKGTVTLIYY